jgi:rubrerythrin
MKLLAVTISGGAIMSKTQDNLREAFSGESQARNKYMFFAKVARKQGYHYVAKIFEETAENEVQHAKENFKRLKGIGDTATNLKAAIDGEHHEHTSMYPEFAKIARKEGDEEAAKLFEEIAKVEQKHEARFKKLLEMVKADAVYKRSKKIYWKCSKCGHIHYGEEPPTCCPCCKHPTEYFEPECMCFEDDCCACCGTDDKS